MERRFPPDDDGRVTLRVPRAAVALVAAVVLHVGATVITSLLPEPKKVPQRIELTFAQAPSPPAAPSAPSAPASREAAKEPRRERRRKASPLPYTSPVAPVLPPSESPPENRAELPSVPVAPEPSPPPQPSSWRERLMAQLAETAPKSTRYLAGPLAPSTGNLEQIAHADPRMHDEETERRMAADYGPFFRRGVEALRRTWHPIDVLRVTERDPSRRCGAKNRTTFAVAILDRSGNVVDVELKSPSGCPDLDDEAIAAFKRVAQFPHPPEGIFVAPDGTPMETARYPVRFMVTFDGGLRLDWRG